MTDKSNRGSSNLLDLLHGSVAQTLTAEITRYKNGEVKDAEGNTLPIPSALLAQAIKFLKDNGIDSPGTTNKKLALLQEQLPDFDDDPASNVVMPH